MEEQTLGLVLVLFGALVGVAIAWLIFRAREDGHRRETEQHFELKLAQFPGEQQEKVRNLEMELARASHEYKLKLTQTLHAGQTSNAQALHAAQTTNAQLLEQLRAEFQNQERIIRQKSVSASRRTTVGKFIERFVPFLERV